MTNTEVHSERTLQNVLYLTVSLLTTLYNRYVNMSAVLNSIFSVCSTLCSNCHCERSRYVSYNKRTSISLHDNNVENAKNTTRAITKGG